LPSVFKTVATAGLHGVQLFYIVSAFTMFLTLHNREGNEEFIWPKFFIRRFFRIAPMYYLGICYFLWQDGLGSRYWLGDADHLTLASILSNFFFVHSFNPYWINSVVPGGWSIAIEMLFYCLIPLLFFLIKNTNQAFCFVLVTLVLRLLLHIFLTQFPLIGNERLWQEYLYLYLPSQLPVFGLGILFYFIVTEGYKISMAPLLILITAITLVTQFIGAPIGVAVLPNHFLFSCAFVVLCIALSRYDFKLLVNPFFIYIGKVSFSMYLVHFAVIHWLVQFNMADYLTATTSLHAIINYFFRFLIVTSLTILISSVFYRLVEVPMQAVGKRIINRWFQYKEVLATQRAKA
jgi:peptidoglycan/LPS O-acetylase OafA/YrhL